MLNNAQGETSHEEATSIPNKTIAPSSGFFSVRASPTQQHGSRGLSGKCNIQRWRDALPN